MSNRFKQFFIGRPLKTIHSVHERLTKKAALAIFSSDALSSVAYATEEILLVLTLAGGLGITYGPAIGLAIVVLLTTVILSYRQIIRAYPAGGGAFVVTKENLGVNAGLVAGASLLVDYILTVAVSLSAGVAAVTSAFPALYPERVPVALTILGLLMLVNLRGVRESARVFALPTYAFIGSLGALIIIGLWRAATGQLTPVPETAMPLAIAAVGPFLILRAFSAGCTALTGIEAISDGVQAFRQPEAKNARTTLGILGFLLAFLFLGLTLLAYQLRIFPMPGQTVVSLLARQVFEGGFMYYLIQAATAVVLLLAANTSFSGFPRLASILAEERFLPTQLENLGDRLVYSNGIIVLTVFSGLLILLFGADTHRLIPLYAVGVFTGFSLSQFGMVKRWFKERGSKWIRQMAMNLIGGGVTAVVLLIITVTKFTHGAWAVVAVIPALVILFKGIRRHYASLKAELSLDEEKAKPVPNEHLVILFVGKIHKGTMAALRHAKALRPDQIKAIHVSFNDQEAGAMRQKWTDWGMEIPLIIVPSPYRETVGILTHYIREIARQHPEAAITVILPELICTKWWQLLLHNRSARRIRRRLHRERVAVVTVPIQLR